jgi:perosamine synthetase
VTQKLLIPLSRPALGEREAAYIEDCIYSGRVSADGNFPDELERRFAKWIGARSAVATNSGTAALHVVLAALGVRRGDEVIVPSLAYIALANAVSYTGARPVIADVSAESWTIDPKEIAARITPRTKGIIVSHLYGHAADLDEINAVASRGNLFVIEAAGDAIGTLYRGERAGTLMTAGCFSFAHDKTLTTGGGGMVVTGDEELAVRVRFLAEQGRVSRREYLHSWIGFNYRMSNLSAALGLAQMDELDLRVTVRRDVGLRYRTLLAGIPGISVGPEVPWGTPSYGRVAMLVEPPFPLGKDELRRQLRRDGIESEPFYFPIHMQLPYLKARRRNLPVSEDLYSRGLLLPASTLLANEELLRVAGVIRRLYAEGALPARKKRKRGAQDGAIEPPRGGGETS